MRNPKKLLQSLFSFFLWTLIFISLSLTMTPMLVKAEVLHWQKTILMAQNNRTRRIQFDRGATSKTIEDSVVRGTRDIYLLGAKLEQIMEISLSSLENNASFDLVSPMGKILFREVTQSGLVLPSDGDYQIIVGGTRGNANYSLFVSINDAEVTKTLKTKNFQITIWSGCIEGSVTCDKVFYEGTNINTGDSLQLVGKSLHTLCADEITPCRFLGYEFLNGNYRYILTEDGSLSVYQGETLIKEEQGTWQN